MEGVGMVPNILHLSSTYGTKILSPFSLYASLLMPTMWNFSWWKKSSLVLTVFLFMYMDKLVCRNSDINKEVIMEK